MKKYLLVVCFILVISCKDKSATPFGLNLYFENPQPIDDSEISKIPNKFIGNYTNPDSIFLKIDQNTILQQINHTFRIGSNEMDSLKTYFIFSDGKLIERKTKEIFSMIKKGDSLELTSKSTDTIFKFSNTQKAKRINGFLILNIKDSVFWRIKIINLQKKQLSIKDIGLEEDIKKLDSVTKQKAKRIDSSSFIIKPTRKEFKNILKLRDFGNEYRFTKISK